jgi:aromatase
MRWVQDFHMRPTAPLDDEQMTNRINTNSRREMGVIKAKIEEVAAGRAAWPAGAEAQGSAV